MNLAEGEELGTNILSHDFAGLRANSPLGAYCRAACCTIEIARQSNMVGGELGGLGAGYEIWSANARVN